MFQTSSHGLTRSYRRKFVYGAMYGTSFTYNHSRSSSSTYRFERRIRSTRVCPLRLWNFSFAELNTASRICDSRKYTYFFPTYLLIPPKPGSGLDRSLQQYAATLSPDPQASPVEGGSIGHSFWAGEDTDTHEEELARKRAWRVPPQQMESLRQAAQKFEGTHNFHNFTVARDFSDRSNQRHMKKIEVNGTVFQKYIVSLTIFFADCRSCCIRRNRVDQCPLPRAKFHAASGTFHFEFPFYVVERYPIFSSQIVGRFKDVTGLLDSCCIWPIAQNDGWSGAILSYRNPRANH